MEAQRHRRDHLERAHAALHRAAYLLYLGLVVLSLGILTLTARWRIQGLGGVIGAAGVSTVVVFDMVNTLTRTGSSGLGPGFRAAFVAPLVLLAAGTLAVTAAQRERAAGFAALNRPDWTSWVVLALAVAGVSIWMSWSEDDGSSHGMWFVMLTLAAIAGLAPIVHRGRPEVPSTG